MAPEGIYVFARLPECRSRGFNRTVLILRFYLGYVDVIVALFKVEVVT